MIFPPRRTLMPGSAHRCQCSLLQLAAMLMLLACPVATQADVSEAARLAGDYLVRVTGPDGRFLYEYHAERDVPVEGYNMLRHAGTIYAMAELHAVSPRDTLAEAMDRALGYLRSQTVEREHDALLLDGGREVKLGGNALAVLAIARWTEATGKSTHMPLARKFAAWMVNQQRPTGEFPIHIISYPSGKISPFISLYYPGEAAFALATLGDMLQNREMIEAARLAALHTATARYDDRIITEAEHDHWLLYALDKLHEIERHPDFVSAARPIVRGMLTTQHRPGTVPPAWVGGWYQPPRATPASTRLEGMIAAWRMFTRAGEPEAAAQIASGIEAGMTYLDRCRITPARARQFPNPAFALGGVTASLTNPSIRIDYVQHALSAWLAWARMKDAR